MKYFTLFILSFGIVNFIYGQYNYSLDICNQDAKIEGKLNLDDLFFNTIIGKDSGISIDTSGSIFNGRNNVFIGKFAGNKNTTGHVNTFIGIDAGFSNQTGKFNTFIGAETGFTHSSGHFNTYVGAKAGESKTQGELNTFIGSSAGQNNQTGSKNTFVGANAGAFNLNENCTFLGFNSGATANNLTNSLIMGGESGVNASGNFNVVLGHNAGQNINGDDNILIGYSAANQPIGWRNIVIGSRAGTMDGNLNNKLIIENSNSSTPLLYGEFDNDRLQVNGSFHVRDAFQLIPRPAPSGSCTSNGEMVYGMDNELYLCKAGTWKQVMTN